VPYYSWCDAGELSAGVKELARAILYALKSGQENSSLVLLRYTALRNLYFVRPYVGKGF
jgi:hypothetical protein